MFIWASREVLVIEFVVQEVLYRYVENNAPIHPNIENIRVDDWYWRWEKEPEHMVEGRAWLDSGRRVAGNRRGRFLQDESVVWQTRFTSQNNHFHIPVHPWSF